MEKKYYYIDNSGKQIGPVAAGDMKYVISPNTLVWCPGMETWMAASSVEELRNVLMQLTPPPISRVVPPPMPPSTDGAEHKGSRIWGILLKIFSIVSIVSSGLMMLFGLLMTLGHDNYSVYDSYYEHRVWYRGIDEEWGILFMMAAAFMLVFSILSLRDVAKTKNS